MFRGRTPAAPPTGYPYIKAWGKKMGSPVVFVERQIGRAKAAGAPSEAIFERYNDDGPTGKWATVSTVVDPMLREELHRWAQDYAGRRLPTPAPATRCDAVIRNGQATGTCDTLLDVEGQCPKTDQHTPVGARR